MNKKIICIITVFGILGGVGRPAFAETTGQKMVYRDVPNSVQKALKSHKDEIKRIEQFIYNGRTIYEVRLDREDASDKFIYIADDGTRVTDRAVALQRKADRQQLNLKNLPKAVQQTFKQKAGSAKMEDIDVDTVNGKIVYDIDFNHNGRMETVRINEDGSIAQYRRHARFDDNQISRRESQLSQSGKVVGKFDKPLAATQKVNFDSVPEAVKQTVRNVAGPNRIEDAERGTLDGRTVYEIAFKENGIHNELRVAEDGSIVQRMAQGTGPYSQGKSLGKVTVDQVPAPVRRAIRAQVGTGEVNDIDKLDVNGKTVYEVGFKRESGGKQHELRIAEDGTVLGEAAGAQK